MLKTKLWVFLKEAQIRITVDNTCQQCIWRWNETEKNKYKKNNQKRKQLKQLGQKVANIRKFFEQRGHYYKPLRAGNLYSIKDMGY